MHVWPEMREGWREGREVLDCIAVLRRYRWVQWEVLQQKFPGGGVPRLEGRGLLAVPWPWLVWEQLEGVWPQHELGGRVSRSCSQWDAPPAVLRHLFMAMAYVSIRLLNALLNGSLIMEYIKTNPRKRKTNVIFLQGQKSRLITWHIFFINMY